ncbi:MAG: FAD:protein FMN transferase [Chloroflexota bacterium]
MKKLKNALAILLTLVTLLVAPAGCAVRASPEKYEETRNMMDTFIRVTVYADDRVFAGKAISAAFLRMEEIAKAASIFDENAEAFKLNRDGYLESPSLDLVRLVRQSIEFNKLTDGYFDITVQPLLELWAAGLWQESAEAQQARVNEYLRLIGSDKIEVTAERISLEAEGMKITLGGITKGYAVDEALRILEGMGVKHAIIAAGGDIGTLGTKPSGEPWNISLVNPDNTSESLAIFRFAQKSISTSGNYERYFSPDKKAHHLMNPKTGYSAGECISVTIVAGSGTQADALATSVFVLGPEKGMRLVESMDDVECFIVDTDREIILSSGMDKYLSESK